MAGLLDLLNSDLGKTLVNSASEQLGQKTSTTSSALNAALPLIIGAMKNNAASPQGAQGLLGALSNSNHDGSILDNLGDFLGDSNATKDGAGILGHIFNGKEKNVAQAVSTKSGMDLSAVMSLLQMAAPVILGYLGRQTRQNNVSDAGGIESLLGSLLGGNAQQDQNLVSQLLDADGDGSVVDDIIGMASGSKKGGLGGILGGMFGK
ncbi:protein of unknown function [Lutibacter agarilyticus]|uniref:DUF937 domain-containing protein n=1 Tax=Lutibacter agarilyticus TaxID=1109740 RepID=A0A238VKE2_9FLAO|nr:DUF937 domain-containing protein [Lutibacter agarilyticus]SNR34577.1 protein of unknown function [Lutibacter agarilyticus]